MADEPFPESFHTVQSCTGTISNVDDGTRKQVDAWLADEDAPPTLTIDDIYGSETTLVRGFVAMVWSSDPEMRRRDRVHRRELRDETPVEDRES